MRTLCEGALTGTPTAGGTTSPATAHPPVFVTRTTGVPVTTSTSTPAAHAQKVVPQAAGVVPQAIPAAGVLFLPSTSARPTSSIAS